MGKDRGSRGPERPTQPPQPPEEQGGRHIASIFPPGVRVTPSDVGTTVPVPSGKVVNISGLNVIGPDGTPQAPGGVAITTGTEHDHDRTIVRDPNAPSGTIAAIMGLDTNGRPDRDIAGPLQELVADNRPEGTGVMSRFRDPDETGVRQRLSYTVIHPGTRTSSHPSQPSTQQDRPHQVPPVIPFAEHAGDPHETPQLPSLGDDKPTIVAVITPPQIGFVPIKQTEDGSGAGRSDTLPADAVIRPDEKHSGRGRFVGRVVDAGSQTRLDGGDEPPPATE